MISYPSQVIKIDDIIYPIMSYVVWFVTPRGLATSIDQALELCRDIGADPNIITAVPVAITDKEGVYEILPG